MSPCRPFVLAFRSWGWRPSLVGARPSLAFLFQIFVISLASPSQNRTVTRQAHDQSFSERIGLVVTGETSNSDLRCTVKLVSLEGADTGQGSAHAWIILHG